MWSQWVATAGEGKCDDRAVAAPGETDLDRILASLEVVRRPGGFVYRSEPAGTPTPPHAVAMVDEGDTITHVIPVSVDDERPEGDHGEFRAAWLTITVATSLDAVGLTAVLSTALAAAGIPANVIAGARHDHVLVPAELADDAIATLRAAASPSSAPLP